MQTREEILAQVGFALDALAKERDWLVSCYFEYQGKRIFMDMRLLREFNKVHHASDDDELLSALGSNPLKEKHHDG